MAKAEIIYKLTELPIESVTLTLTLREAQLLRALTGNFQAKDWNKGRNRVDVHNLWAALSGKVPSGEYMDFKTPTEFHGDCP